ncbi:MAG TPA: hypothetical protein PKL56_11830 [Cyclobacteriaceae bacterium]|nr:hypothetical protein [Cyclobacteriaceae bacterium]HMV07483.1 hypothetical protein [Cyclobacteriaceae bacterium]HMW99162.1 hypothetical protein [Cyclobacteriaceae bacterium]HMX48205.1 hypothetical protein [Cyclobacteriaceae bacterium]HMY95010.1 hypothetical protein [Cyclobacteriaceae bacterium]
MKVKDWLIKGYYLDHWNKISPLFKGNKIRKDETRQELILLLRAFITDLDKTMFQNALDEIIKVILCKEPLNKPSHGHVEKIKYYTPIIVTEFVFSGFTIKELNELFKRIFERDIKITGDKVETKAPLPPELLEFKNNPEAFYEASKKYLDKRNLKQQFEGIYFLFKNSQHERTLVFPLKNVSAYAKIELEYDGVIFSNQLRKKYVTKKTQKGFYSFFTGRRRLFAETKVLKGDETGSMLEALSKIRQALMFFNITHNVEATLDTEDYIIGGDRNFIRKSNFPKIVRDGNSKRFNESKMTTFLDGIDNSITKRLIETEKLYFKALSSHSQDERLVSFWRYLECFFDSDNYDAALIREKISKILSRSSEVSFAFVNFGLAFHILYNQSSGPSLEPERFGVTREELWKMLHPGLVTDFDFKRAHKLIKHPYVTKQLKWQIESSTEVKFQSAYEFYSSILFEAYEQRNLIEHNGVFQRKAVQKVLLTLPRMVLKFRNILSRAAKGNRYKSITEMLEKLESEDPPEFPEAED